MWAFLLFIFLLVITSIILINKWKDKEFSTNEVKENLYFLETSNLGNQSKGEKKTREFLENYFKLPFIRTRPDWLKNTNTGKNLELDCYNRSLGLAVEYNGSQHYYYNRRFHKNYKNYKIMQERDYLKNRLCKQNNVVLITVPYWINEEEIADYLRKALHEQYFMELP